MITIDNIISVKLNYDFKDYNQQDILFFDIETTGFSPERTLLYLIGCIYYKDNSYHTIQWFADEKDSEKNMLVSFFEFMKGYKILVHFNGLGFDVPYIIKKCNHYKLDYTFDNISHLDIYKKVIPYKSFLKLDNYKQKSIEQYLNISRDDMYSGGELIQMYANYLKCRVLDINNGYESITTKELLKVLLLHNSDDIKGLLSICEILYYDDLFNNECEISSAYVENEDFVINARANINLPKLIRYTSDNIYFSAIENNILIKVSLYKDILKYFYDNYNDYYYLPKEDTAIHKSIAIYVDKDFKTKAKAANCYTKKTGIFIPQPEVIYTPYFKNNYKDKISYIEVTDNLIANTDFLKVYVMQILKYIL